MLNYDNCLSLVTDKKLLPTTYKLFIFLMTLLENQSNLKLKRMTQIEISEILGLTKQQVSKSFKELIENNVIYKDNRDYYFNKDIFADK